MDGTERAFTVPSQKGQREFFPISLFSSQTKLYLRVETRSSSARCPTLTRMSPSADIALPSPSFSPSNLPTVSHSLKTPLITSTFSHAMRNRVVSGMNLSCWQEYVHQLSVYRLVLTRFFLQQSYVLHKERNVLFQDRPSGTVSFSQQQNTTRKYTPTTPLVSVAPPFAGVPGVAPGGGPSSGPFEPGSLLAKQVS